MKFFETLILVSCIIIHAMIRAEIDIEAKKNEILSEHNIYRAMHGVPKLEINSEVNIAAQKWADSLALIDDSLTLRTRTRYGENLWMVEGAHMEDLMNNCLNPVKDWYSEIHAYPGYFDNVTFPRYGHFTQLIWKNSKHLGVGIAKSEKGHIFVVCDYNPKGNVIDEFDRNVLPLLEEYQNSALLENPVKSSAKSMANLNWTLLTTCVISVLMRYSWT